MSEEPVSAATKADVKYTDLQDDRDESHWKVLGRVSSGERVLEVGASTGYMTEALMARGCDVVALEPNADAVALAHARGVPVRCAFLGDIKDGLGRFDVVLLVDVIEHVPDAPAMLRDCLDVLGPGGRIIVSVPNIAHWSTRWSLLRGHFDYTRTGLLDDTHVRFYTARSLEALCALVGLEVSERDTTLGLFTYGAVPPWLNRVVNVSWHRRRLVRALARRRPALFGFQNVWVLRPLDA
ncbi:putative S-adenosylmethionine-dependent methyltransferase [Luteitalea pratensis]|uniref:Putative S-adenosylmethionine-dependent methyltransferase n=1 Tax=Luteitalea pratensis TaxID=1855912 RepID=A0A143PNN9_LUTPR|nr:class I SAM-dependent methyltransferase [Luteitalea pratensis]AMY10071.1 putative S-adenosylmethionine-dependent methyltransferase [Luteitalea pratensis]